MSADNINGCDSTSVLNLTINYTDYHYDTITVCGVFYWYADTITQSGTYQQIFAASNSSETCDSIATLEVTILPEYTNIIDTQVHCNSYTWIDGITYTASNNTASYAYLTSSGCDSIVLDLSINNSSTSSTFITTCDSLYFWNGQVIDSSGIYAHNSSISNYSIGNLSGNSNSNTSSKVVIPPIVFCLKMNLQFQVVLNNPIWWTSYN